MLPLLDHQRRTLSHLAEHPRAGDFSDPGLGKSRTAIESAVEPVLVVAPAMIIDGGTWADEIARWRPGLDATVVPYTQLNVRERTANGGSTPTVRLKPEYDRDWGTVVYDEAHYLKGRSTKWTIAAKSIRSERTVLLTGTPLPNWAHEAFVLAQLLRPDEARPGRELGSYWRWVSEFFEVGEKTDRAGRVLAKMAVGDFRSDRTWDQYREAVWGDLVIQHRREDCLDLPPLTPVQWLCPMKGEQARVYRALEKDFVAWLNSGAEIAAWNNAAQSVKLAKCGTGLEVVAPGEASGSSKMDALGTILRDRPRPTLVVAHFRDSVAACAQVCDKIGASHRVVMGGASKNDRLSAVRAFQSGDLQVLCATIDTIGEGLTLHQGGADHVIRVERSYRPSKNEQVIRRLHRMGVEVPITLIDLVTPDSMDQRILQLNDAKVGEQGSALGRDDLMFLAGR